MVACVAYFNLIEVIVPGNIYMVYRDSEQKNIETFWNENDKEESGNEAKILKNPVLRNKISNKSSNGIRLDAQNLQGNPPGQIIKTRVLRNDLTKL